MSKKTPVVVLDIRVKIVIPADTAADLLDDYLAEDVPGKHEKPDAQ